MAAIKHLCNRAPSVSLERSVVANGRILRGENEPTTILLSYSAGRQAAAALLVRREHSNAACTRESKAAAVAAIHRVESRTQSVSGKSLRYTEYVCSECFCVLPLMCAPAYV